MNVLFGVAANRAFAACALVFILALTMVPAVATEAAVGTGRCVLCGPGVAADMLLNILLFVPLGLFLWGAGAGIRGVAIAGFALSIAVEGAQGWVPGRYPSVPDVIFNTAGATLGALLSRHFAATLFRRTWRSSAAAVCWGCFVGAMVPATAWLEAPAPPDSVYYGQWTAELGHFDTYGGRILDARIGPEHVPDGRLEPQSPQLRKLIGARVPVDVRLEAGPPVRAMAPVFSIFDEHQKEILLLAVDRRDIVFRFASRAGALGLRAPQYRLAGGAGLLTPGRTVRLRVEPYGRSGVCMTVDGVGECGVGGDAGLGWALFLPRNWFDRWPPAVPVTAWLALLAFPIGFWGRASRSAVVAGGLVAGPLLIAPAIGLGGGGTIQLVAVIVGVTAGILVGMGLERRARWIAGHRGRGGRVPANGGARLSKGFSRIQASG